MELRSQVAGRRWWRAIVACTITLIIASLPSTTALGAITLTVADLEAVQAYYEHTVGLCTLERSGNRVRLGTSPAGPTLVELVGAPDAPPRPPATTGLFHLALLVASRVELARAVRRVVGSGSSLTGASDHLVSEALYLRDPEGNGIEIYRDRPREEWRRVGGELAMATEPLDLDGVMSELAADEDDDAMAAGTVLGHVHLQVADIAEAEAFYAGVLGFDVIMRSYPGALFVSAGGYHHHIGLNTWAGAGAPPPPAGARGLRWFDVVLGDDAALDRVAERLRGAQIAIEHEDGAVLTADPSGNRLRLRATPAR